MERKLFYHYAGTISSCGLTNSARDAKKNTQSETKNTRAKWWVPRVRKGYWRKGYSNVRGKKRIVVSIQFCKCNMDVNIHLSWVCTIKISGDRLKLCKAFVCLLMHLLFKDCQLVVLFYYRLNYSTLLQAFCRSGMARCI